MSKYYVYFLGCSLSWQMIKAESHYAAKWIFAKKHGQNSINDIQAKLYYKQKGDNMESDEKQTEVRIPSDYTNYPWNSVTKKAECEIVAQNIMKILKRTGNEFRSLSWKEYKQERLKDSAFTPHEKEYFNNVIDYCESSQTANLFSPKWKEV